MGRRLDRLEPALAIGDEYRAFLKHKADQGAFRDALMRFQGAVEESEDRLGHNAMSAMVPVTHSFADGQYIRQMDMEAGTVVVGHIHARNHPYFITRGDLSIITEQDGEQRIQAPHNGITLAGTKRILYAHEDSTLITVHRTDNLDVSEIEREVLAKSFDDLELTPMQTEHIDALIKKIGESE